MRVISQDGIVDFPYEKAVLYAEYESVIAKVGNERCVIGIYSTTKKQLRLWKCLEKNMKIMNFIIIWLIHSILKNL